MKIITKCVIDMTTLQVIEEESYEYYGSVDECKGGGGGGSGKVDYPAYMKTWHGLALDGGGVDTLTSSITDVIDAALGNSPWTGQSAYNPDADIVQIVGAPNTLQTLVTLLSSGTTLNTLVSGVLDHARVDADAAEFAADLDARLIAEVLPRFEAGMRDINAVSSSAFVIGRAVIEENQDRLVAKYSADLHSKAFSDDALKLIGLKLEYQKFVSQMIAESYRVKLVAKKEENEEAMKIDEADAKWDLELFQYGANVLASIGGGVAQPKVDGPSKAQSAIGGAMSGAAAGAMLAFSIPTLGLSAVAGAAIGGALGLGSSLI